MTDTATTDTIEWNIKAKAYSDQDDFNSIPTTTVAVSDSSPGNSEVIHRTDATGDITVEGSPQYGDLVQFHIGRNPSNDTYTGDAHLIGVAIQYKEGITSAESAW